MRRVATRVAVRDGLVIRLKTCTRCGVEKVAHEDMAFSEFQTKGRNADGSVRGWASRCRPCTSELRKERGPAESKEVRQARSRATYERTKADPVRWAAWKKRNAEAVLRWRAKDPDRVRELQRNADSRRRKGIRERRREDARMYYRLKMEREGKQVRAVGTVVDGTCPRKPAAPFAQWLEAYAEKVGVESSEWLGELLHIDARRIRAIRSEGQTHVSLDIVDTALSHTEVEVEVGGVTVFGLDDLYPLDEVA